jgi:hypothetical protein
MSDAAFSLVPQFHDLNELIGKARAFMQAAKAPGTGHSLALSIVKVM